MRIAETKRSITGSETLCLPRELEEQRFGLAVFRHEADADIGAHRVRGRSDDDRPAIDPQRSAGQIHHAETGQKEVELAHALKPGDADDFPRAQAERGVLQLAESREALRPEHLGLDPPGGGRARRKCMRQRPPYDHGDDGVVVEVRDRPGGDMCAISQYRHGVAKRAHFP